MRRIWLSLSGRAPADFKIGEILELAGDAFHHAIQVSRLKQGEKFEAISGHRELLQFEVKSVAKKSADIQVVGRRLLPKLANPEIHLALSICKWDAFDWIIEKSVELGVTSIQPILSENSFIKKSTDISEGRYERWQRIIESATTQSSRGSLLQLKRPMHLSEFVAKINQTPAAKCLFAYEGARHLSLNEALNTTLKTELKEIWALVGSEGGFSQAEADAMKFKGLEPITMGDQILRVETACIAIMSVIKYEFGLMKNFEI